MNSTPESVSLCIKAATWTKETNDLYDFDTKDISTSESNTNSTVFLVNVDEKIDFIKKKAELSKLLLKNKKNVKIIAEASPNGSNLFIIQTATSRLSMPIRAVFLPSTTSRISKGFGSLYPRKSRRYSF